MVGAGAAPAARLVVKAGTGTVDGRRGALRSHGAAHHDGRFDDELPAVRRLQIQQGLAAVLGIAAGHLGFHRFSAGLLVAQSARGRRFLNDKAGCVAQIGLFLLAATPAGRG